MLRGSKEEALGTHSRVMLAVDCSEYGSGRFHSPRPSFRLGSRRCRPPVSVVEVSRDRRPVELLWASDRPTSWDCSAQAERR